MRNNITANSPFDTNKWYLGKLCMRNHNWNNTSQTVRSLSGKDCRMCAIWNASKPKEERRYKLNQPPEYHFARNVNVSTPDKCWLWQGTIHEKRDRANYGSWNQKQPIRGIVSRRSHRAAFLLYVGDIPEGMQVLHKCDISLCCNPNHLYLGTPADNVRDRDERGLFVNWYALPKYAHRAKS